MAFNKENFYQEGNSQEFFFSRTNPLANPANAEILKIKKTGCCDTEFALVAEYAYNGMGQTFEIDFSAPTSTIDSRYVKVVVTDGLGNFATAVGTGTVSSLTVDVTGLDVSVVWTVSVVIEVLSNASVDCPCMVEYTFPYNSFVGSVTVDTTTLYAARVAVFEADGTTAIADAGTYDLGTFPDGGTTEDFSIVIKNTGASVLTISSVTFSGDVLSFTLPSFAGVIYPGNSITLKGTVDASGAAGSYTGAIVINSDASNVAVYNVTIDYTLA
jgi:hypothetical protein